MSTNNTNLICEYCGGRTWGCEECRGEGYVTCECCEKAPAVLKDKDGARCSACDRAGREGEDSPAVCAERPAFRDGPQWDHLRAGL